MTPGDQCEARGKTVDNQYLSDHLEQEQISRDFRKIAQNRENEFDERGPMEKEANGLRAGQA
jgi:hypothetical protein